MKTYKEYLLDCLQEECAEVIQVISKAKRFGLEDIWPNEAKNPEKHSNERRLDLELNDVYAVFMMLEQAGVCLTFDPALHSAKIERVNKYLEYSRSKGLVE